MVNHYDDTLRYRIPANNDSSDIVLNRDFCEWTEQISDSLLDREDFGRAKYTGKEDRLLLEKCVLHESRFHKPVNENNVIMVTHPFYLSLSHMQYVKTETVSKEVEQYLDTLINLLEKNQKDRKAGIVVMETVHHYAAATSLLLENGLVDQVIFSEFDSGFALNKKDLWQFRKKNLFCCGGYNDYDEGGKCLNATILDLQRHVPKSRIYAIRDLTLNSPCDCSSTLRPKHVMYLKDENVLPMESVEASLGYK